MRRIQLEASTSLTSVSLTRGYALGRSIQRLGAAGGKAAVGIHIGSTGRI